MNICLGLATIKRNAFLVVCAGGRVMPSDFRSEGTVVQQNENTYWFKDDFKGEQVPTLHAIAVVEAIVGRKLNTFESKLLEHFSIRLGVARVCEISFAFVCGNLFEKRGDCSPKFLNSSRLHFA